jgi:hypothetical protein
MEKDTEGREEQWNKNELPTADDVRRAAERLKNNRSPGPDIYS